MTDSHSGPTRRASTRAVVAVRVDGDAVAVASAEEAWTGWPAALPAMSQSAISMPLSAAAELEAAAAAGSMDREVGGQLADPERIAPDQAAAERLDLGGDRPLAPGLGERLAPAVDAVVGVDLTKTQFFHIPESTRNDCTRSIFIAGAYGPSTPVIHRRRWKQAIADRTAVRRWRRCVRRPRMVHRCNGG